MDLEWLTGCQQRRIGFEQSFAPKFGGALLPSTFLQRFINIPPFLDSHWL